MPGDALNILDFLLASIHKYEMQKNYYVFLMNSNEMYMRLQYQQRIIFPCNNLYKSIAINRSLAYPTGLEASFCSQ